MGSVGRWLHEREHIQLLLQWRWLVLVIAIPISLVIELIEGESVGLHLLDEVLLDGLILPITTWLVLTFAAQKMAGQFKREADLERRQHFTQRLGEHREYYDLAYFLVRFPATILPVEHASLFVCDLDQLRLRSVTEWSSAGASTAPRRGEAAPGLCAACQTSPVASGSSLGLCAGCLAQESAPRKQHLCLVLVHEQTQVGVLQLRWQPGAKPDGEALELLSSLGPEIAAALARTIEDTRETARVYREAQAHERRRITQELHDSLAQQVFYLNLSLDQLADDSSFVANEAVRRKLDSMRDVAADVYEQIRNNLSILRAWEQVNLTEAVSELARATARNADLSVEIDVQGEPAWLSPHTCEHLYSAVREALNNVVKHARAQHVHLAMGWSPELLTISLADDGVGFDPQSGPREGHYGLALMRETIDALDGSLTITSSPGQGTSLQIAIPLLPQSPTLQTRPSLSQRLDAALDLAI
ncbi:MAG TPA: sensor histidine kinase [Chloroflexaceae bacterium]|nr:sensor histidine kinase [Chloroflexaceae bacterium]